MKGRSYSKQQHSFAVSPNVQRPRSTFSRPSWTTTAIDASFIYPVLIDEVLPGDTYNLKMNLFGRLATPIRPFMSNLYIDSFMFFCPNRIVWENWQKFQGEKLDPGDTTTYEVPQISIAGGVTSGAGKLADFMGLPTQPTSFEVNALPFRMYNRCWAEFFRDQNIQDSPTLDIGDANSTEANHVLLRRGKRKDYLTGALPWPQRGDAVTMSLGTRADVKGIGKNTQTYDGGGTPTVYETGASASTTYAASAHYAIGPSSDEITYVQEDPANSGFPNIYADLTNATAATINSLRQSIAIQHVLELDARSGTRYVEQLKARFGVTSPDFRLQRPEYLGGGSTNINVTPVSATAFNATSNLEVGDQHGFGTAAGQHGFTHSFTEHGFLMVLVSIRSDQMYYQGINRQWSRKTRYDYYEPELAHLGEQSILNKEIYSDDSANDDLVFGYAERYSEYKYGNSMCTGIMRPSHPTSLDVWHLAQVFSSLPTLSDAFIREDPPIDRVIQVVTEPHIILDCWFDNKCTRVMPVFNTPGLSRL